MAKIKAARHSHRFGGPWCCRCFWGISGGCGVCAGNVKKGESVNNKNLYNKIRRILGISVAVSLSPAEMEEIKEAVKKDQKEAEKCSDCVGHDGKNYAMRCYECKKYYGNLFKRRK